MGRGLYENDLEKLMWTQVVFKKKKNLFLVDVVQATFDPMILFTLLSHPQCKIIETTVTSNVKLSTTKGAQQLCYIKTCFCNIQCYHSLSKNIQYNVSNRGVM